MAPLGSNAALYQRTQWGPETTRGTVAAADVLLRSLRLEPSPQADITLFRSQASKFNDIAALEREWMQYALSGQATFDEIVYPLASVISAPVITTPVGATLARQHVFASDPDGPDDPLTFTIEHGSSIYATRSKFGVVTDFNIPFQRAPGGLALGGTLIASAEEDAAATFTAAPATLPLVPILGGQLSAYLDDASGDLGTTLLTRTFSGGFSIGGRYAPAWFMNALIAGFADIVESPPTITLELLMEVNATSMGLRSTMRAGDTKFIRIEAVGAEIEAGHNYQFTLDLAGKISAPRALSDQDGIYAVGWTFTTTSDPTWGKAFEVTVINTVSAL